MFSLPKLLVLALIVGAAWYGYRWVQRVNANQQTKVRRRRTEARAREVEDMVLCSVCQTYVPAEKHEPCDRPDCPYAR